MTSNWTLFRPSIMKTAARICGQEVVIICHGSNPGACWWTTAVREAAVLKRVLLNVAE